MKLKIQFIGHKDTLHKVSLSLSPKLSIECIGLSDSLTHSLREWVRAYCNGTPVPLQNLPHGSPFQTKIWSALTQIPFGTTLSYQELAAQTNSPRAARAAGTACGQNPWPLLIPCHRIIRTDGTLGGFAFPLEIKQRLLDFEREHSLSLKQ